MILNLFFLIDREKGYLQITVQLQKSHIDFDGGLLQLPVYEFLSLQISVCKTNALIASQILEVLQILVF